jgi:hypothetical protein
MIDAGDVGDDARYAAEYPALTCQGLLDPPIGYVRKPGVIQRRVSSTVDPSYIAHNLQEAQEAPQPNTDLFHLIYWMK